MSPSDLAFAVVVLEENITNWRRLAQLQFHTGCFPTITDVVLVDKTRELLFDTVAGEEAKRRYDSLNVYFYRNYCCSANDNQAKNVACLQKLLNNKVSSNHEQIESCRNKSATADVIVNDGLLNDISHRVFWHLQS